MHLWGQRKRPFSQLKFSQNHAKKNQFGNLHRSGTPFSPKQQNIFPNFREKAPFSKYLDKALMSKKLFVTGAATNSIIPSYRSFRSMLFWKGVLAYNLSDLII